MNVNLLLKLVARLANLSVQYSFNKLAEYCMSELFHSESIEDKLKNREAWNNIINANNRVLYAQNRRNKGHWNQSREALILAMQNYRDAHAHLITTNDYEASLIKTHCELCLGICSGFIGDWESKSIYLSDAKDSLARIIIDRKREVNLKRGREFSNLIKWGGTNVVLSGTSLAIGATASPVLPIFSAVTLGLPFLCRTISNPAKVEKRIEAEILSDKVPGHQYSVEQLRECLSLLD